MCPTLGIERAGLDHGQVYKYRGVAELRRDLKSLFTDSFFAPTAAKLNDPTEGALNEKLARELQGGVGQDLVDAFTSLTNMRHTVGIYSLSRTASDELMWAHYADSHHGYCIEYDLERLVLEARNQWSVLDVTYSDTPPSLSILDALLAYDGQTIVRPLIGHKSKRWEYEREVRVITTRAGSNHYARAAVTGIYFGCRCAEETMTRIRRCLRGRPITYASMNFPDGSYQLASEPLSRSDVDGALLTHCATVEQHAIVSQSDLGEFAGKYDHVLRAVEHVRRDPACKIVVNADVSRSGKHQGQVYVQYETSVRTDLFGPVTWYFT